MVHPPPRLRASARRHSLTLDGLSAFARCLLSQAPRYGGRLLCLHALSSFQRTGTQPTALQARVGSPTDRPSRPNLGEPCEVTSASRALSTIFRDPNDRPASGSASPEGRSHVQPGWRPPDEHRGFYPNQAVTCQGHWDACVPYTQKAGPLEEEDRPSRRTRERLRYERRAARRRLAATAARPDPSSNKEAGSGAPTPCPSTFNPPTASISLSPSRTIAPGPPQLTDA